MLSLIHMPLPRTLFNFTEKHFNLSTTLKYFKQKDFPLSLLLLGLSASLWLLGKKLQSESKFHKFMQFAELLILDFLSILSKFLES